MCLWILTGWIQLNLLSLVISMDLKNYTAENYMNNNKSETRVNIEIQENFKIAKPYKHDSENIQDNLKNVFNGNGAKAENNTTNFTTTTFLVKNTEIIKYSSNITLATKPLITILKINKTTPDDIVGKANFGGVNDTKESNKNISRRNDYDKILNILSVTSENRIKFHGKEYILSKTDQDSIVRAVHPKIESFKLGNIHFSHEMEILNGKITKDPKSYATMFFDSDEDSSPNLNVFKQKIDIKDANYKTPADAFESTDKRAKDHSLTSTVTVRLTTKTAKKKSEKPYRKELHQERILMKMGPFTFFIYKLMEYLAAKRPSRVMKELTDQFLDVSLQLFQERPNLVEFGQPFRLGVIDFFTNIRTYPADTLRKMASIFHKALPKRWELFHVLVNVLYERIDQLYQQSEIHTLSDLLESMKKYPSIEKNSTQFVKCILVDAVVNPFTREGKTKRRLEMLARLNAYISFAFYKGRYLDLPGFDEANASPEITGVVPSTGITNREIDSIYRFQNTRPMEPSSNNDITQGVETTEINNVTDNYVTFDENTKSLVNSVSQKFETASITSVTSGYGISSVKTKAKKRLKGIGRSGSENINEQEGDVITDEEDILKKRLYKGSQALEKNKFHDDDMLSSYLKYVSKHEPLKKRFEKKISKDKLLKQNAPQSSKYTKKIRNNKHNISEDPGKSGLVFEFIGKASSISTTKRPQTSSKKPAHLGKIWKEVLGKNEARGKKNENKHFLKEKANLDTITELIVKPNLETGKPKYDKFFDNDIILSSSVTKKTAENILREKIENYNYANQLTNRNTNTQAPAKTTDSFLELLLKLDELVNSGERGVLDEILNTDEKIKDSTFQKIEAENEKFLEKEAAVKIVRKPIKIHTTTKHHMITHHPESDKIYETAKQTKGYVKDKLKNTVKIKELKPDEIYETITLTKKNIQDKNEKAVKAQSHELVVKYQKNKESSVTEEKQNIIDTTKGHDQHTEEALRSIKNNNQNNINQVSKDEKTAYYTKKKIAYRQESDHKKTKAVKNINYTKRDFYLQTQMNNADDNSTEINNSYTLTKMNLNAKIKAKTSPVTKKPKSKYKNKKYYLTKNILRKLKKGHSTKEKSTKEQKEYTFSQKSKRFKETSKTTLRRPTKEITKDHVKFFKEHKKVNTSKNHSIKSKKSRKQTENYNYTKKSLREIQKGLDQKPSKPVVKYSTKKISKPGTPTERNSAEVFGNIHKSKKKKQYLQKHQAQKTNDQIKKDSQDDYDSSSSHVTKTIKENVVDSIEDALTNLKKAATRYRPPERMNNEFLRQKKEKKKKKKRKHSKKYRPAERMVGHIHVTKKERKQIRLRNQQNSGDSYAENNDKKGEENENISEDKDNPVWNPTNSVERAVKQSSDDYYVVQGGEKSKIIFQEDEKRYELKKYVKTPKVSNKNLPGDSYHSNEKDNYSMSTKKEKLDDNFRARKRYTNNKTISSKWELQQRSKGNVNKEKNDSGELTELLDKVIDQDSADSSKKIGKNYEDDDGPINEYTLKPVQDLNTENVVYTTEGIFDELKKLKNRLFHQNFRRGMNRKHKITLNELFLKKRAHIKKINEESSYSDDEEDLKQKLQDALLQGRDNDLYRKARSQNSTEISRKMESFNQYEKINEVSDSVDQELVLKSNIYKGLGFKEFN